MGVPEFLKNIFDEDTKVGRTPRAGFLSCSVVMWSTYIHNEIGWYLGSTPNGVTDLGCDLGLVYNEAVLYTRYRGRGPGIHTSVCFSHNHFFFSCVVFLWVFQAEGLWLGLVERALSEAELDLSFEALLVLGREAPQGLPMLAGTFFERMCGGGGGSARDWRKTEKG